MKLNRLKLFSLAIGGTFLLASCGGGSQEKESDDASSESKLPKHKWQ